MLLRSHNHDRTSHHFPTYASPPLAGPTSANFACPSGPSLAWLQSDDDGNRLDLWLGTWNTGEDFSARRLFSGGEESPARPARKREGPTRTASPIFLRVTEFHWRADGQALRFTLNGVA